MKGAPRPVRGAPRPVLRDNVAKGHTLCNSIHVRPHERIPVAGGGRRPRPPAPRGVRVWRSLEPEPQSGRLPGSFTVQAPPQVTLGLERRPRFCFLSLLSLPTRETGSMA